MNAATSHPPLPDHLSTDPRSPHYVAAVFEHDVGIRFNDRERFDVAEYCLSEGWVRVPSGKTVDRKGNPLMIKLKGKVEAFYRGAGGTGADAADDGAAAATPPVDATKAS